MFKWAQDRNGELASAGSGEGIDPVSSNRDRAATEAGVSAQRTTLRVMAISSVVLPAVSRVPVVSEIMKRMPAALHGPRRPGVYARWKDQNRLPLQGVG